MSGLIAILGKIGFDWQVALANLVNFLIIFFILKKFAFKPIGTIISDRQKKIQDGLDNARKAETELMMASVKKEEILKEAKEEAQLFISETIKTRNQILEKARIKAQADADKIITEAEKTKEKESQKMRKEIREQSIALVLSSTEKLLKEKMSAKTNEQYIKKLMESFS